MFVQKNALCRIAYVLLHSSAMLWNVHDRPVATPTTTMPCMTWLISMTCQVGSMCTSLNRGHNGTHWGIRFSNNALLKWTRVPGLFTSAPESERSVVPSRTAASLKLPFIAAIPNQTVRFKLSTATAPVQYLHSIPKETFRHSPFVLLLQPD